MATAGSVHHAWGVTTMPRWRLGVQRTAPVTFPDARAKQNTSETEGIARCVMGVMKMPRWCTPVLKIALWMCLSVPATLIITDKADQTAPCAAHVRNSGLSRERAF